MKNTSLIAAFCLAITLIFSSNSYAQEFPALDKTPMDVAWYPAKFEKSNNKTIKVVYSRPQLIGRYLEKLLINYEIWAGENETTEITFYKTVSIGDNKVPPGTYTLYIVPDEKKWEIILNKGINTIGTEFYNPEMDLLRYAAIVNMDETSLQAFSIYFEEGKDNEVKMHMGWGNKRVTVPIAIN